MTSPGCGPSALAPMRFCSGAMTSEVSMVIGVSVKRWKEVS
jgi:hypothetical protein